MIELAHIFRRHGPNYQAKYAEQMLPSHRQAMRAVTNCRTEALGGHVYRCDHCDEERYSYHSCRNRHCPKCQHNAAEDWLERQQDFLPADAIFPAYLYLTWRTERACPQQPESDLQSTLPCLGGSYTRTRPRPTFCWWSDWHDWYPAYPSASSGQALGTRPELPSTRSLPGTWRRPRR